MPECPNCGLEALRTKDWVCQWCGYPLISNSFKTIDKTYKELQEERSPAQMPPPETTQPRPRPESRPEPQPRIEQPEQPVYEMPERPVSPSQPHPKAERAAPEPPVERQPEAIPPRIPEEQARPEAKTTPPVAKTPVVPEPEPKPEPEPEPYVPEAVEDTAPESPQYEEEAPPEEATPPARQELQDEAQLEPQEEFPQEPAIPEEQPPVQNEPLPSASKPEFNMEPEPVPDFEIEPEDIEDGMEIAVEQIDALFRKDQDVANHVFTGKTFIINGIVEKVFIRDHLDIRYIMLTGIMQGISWNLRCTFEKENTRDLSGLQEGQVVKVQGTYDGVGKNIIFKDCALV
ncbi:MAG: hypothetical protein PHG35_03740 [Dehalococcoidales bacterium]|nr:hypothetical protein [Dehalococcoidales bacterium]